MAGGGTEDSALHPRPQLTRERWWSLDGPWDFALDRTGGWRAPAEVVWDAVIEVPFAPETRGERRRRHRASSTPAGTAGRSTRRRSSPASACSCTSARSTTRRTVWVNGMPRGAPRGRLHAVLRPTSRPCSDATAPRRVVVRAEDDPHDLAKPRGKQDWQLEPHSIWYPRTSGIWQTVWLELVPADAHRARCAGRPASSTGTSACRPRSKGRVRPDLRLRVRLSSARDSWPTTPTASSAAR